MIEAQRCLAGKNIETTECGHVDALGKFVEVRAILPVLILQYGVLAQNSRAPIRPKSTTGAVFRDMCPVNRMNVGPQAMPVTMPHDNQLDAIR